MYIAVYLIVLFVGFAMMVREGLWSNAIALVNILVSGLVAFGFYSPLAIYLDEMLDGQYTYVLDFVCIWGLFVVAMVICSSLTGMASRVRMRFKNPIDPIGGPVVGLLAAWSLAAFVMATLHTSPMPKDAFGGGLVYDSNEVDNAFYLTAPDIGWLKFVERMSRPDSLGRGERGGFSAKAWVQIYADHREKFSKAPGIRVRRS